MTHAPACFLLSSYFHNASSRPATCGTKRFLGAAVLLLSLFVLGASAFARTPLPASALSSGSHVVLHSRAAAHTRGVGVVREPLLRADNVVATPSGDVPIERLAPGRPLAPGGNAGNNLPILSPILSPVGTVSSAVTVSPVSLSFTGAALGKKSAAQTVTLTNHLSTSLSVSAPVATGDFAVASNTCGASVGAGKSCTLGVTFTPTAAGVRTGKLTVAYGAAGSPSVVALSGNGSGSELVSITVTPVNPSITAGSTQQFTATGVFSGGATENLTALVMWGSSASGVATINAAGFATSLAAGSTIITASYAVATPAVATTGTPPTPISPPSTLSGSTTLTVTAPTLVSIAVTPANSSIAAGATLSFKATGTYSNGSTQNLTSSVTWTSSAPAVATISAAGLASALAPGQTTIAAASGAISASTTLTVTAGFVLTGNLNTPMQYQTATLLDDGMVLMSGGYNNFGGNSPYASVAELYDPTAGTFTSSGSLNTPRAWHTATLLNNGMVLIVGGLISANTVSGSAATASTELYNPATGVFTPTGSLNTARYWHTATLLANGTVLIAGGLGNNGYTNTAELYDPATGAFSSTTGNMEIPRVGDTATLLPSGMVLFAGGDYYSYGTTAELYNPATGTFTYTGSMNDAREWHTGTLLNNGLVLMAGGAFDNNGNLTAGAELYNPVTASFTLTGSLNDAREDHSATLLTNGTVLVAGGFDINGPSTSAELYNPASGSFNPTGSLNDGRGEQTATLLNDGQVLVAGGADDNGSIATAEVYEPGTLTPSGLVSIAVSPNSPKLGLGSALRFTALGTFSGGDTEQLAEVTWSSDAAVISISNDASNPGEAYAVATGTATVSACAGAVCGSTRVTVGPRLVSIAVTPANGALAPGSSVQLYATGTFSDGSTQDVSSSVSWSSSAPAVATIDEGGLASGLAAGTTTITAAWGAVQSSTTLTVMTGTVLTGPMSTPRVLHTATLLNFGGVLVAGGYNASGYVTQLEIYFSDSGGFAISGGLETARAAHTATLLNTGTVLFAGGYSSSGVLASAEVFNPANDAISYTGGSLNTARYAHTATLLNNGMVLIAGGLDVNSNPTTSAELFDPTSQTFMPTGSLNTARAWHTATLLNNGLVLIAGGYNSNGSLASAELYDPLTGSFTATGSMDAARAYQTATLLSNGQVLVAGGLGSGGGYLASAEVYDPAHANFLTIGSLNAARVYHAAALLNNGTVLIAGGYNSGGFLASQELYNPATAAFSAAGSLASAVGSPTATLLADGSGRVLIAGGYDSTGYFASAELYAPATLTPPDLQSIAITPLYPLVSPGTMQPLIAMGTFSDGSTAQLAAVTWSSSDTAIAQISNDVTNPGVGFGVAAGNVNITATAGNIIGSTVLTVRPTGFVETGNLTTPRTYHTATLLNNGLLLMAGGVDQNGNTLISAELYNPALDEFTATGSLHSPRSLHTATLLNNGMVLNVSGSDNALTCSVTEPTAELYNPTTATFSYTVGNPLTPRCMHTATLLNNGLVLIAGGYNGGSLASAELYNPATGMFTSTGNLINNRFSQTATLLNNGLVLIAGGTGAGFLTLNSAELYNPVTGNFSATGSMQDTRTGHTATLLNNGMVLIAGGTSDTRAELYNPATGLFTYTASLHTARSNHAATLLNNGMVLIAGGNVAFDTATTSAELYNPNNATFTLTASLITAVEYQTATLLNNGMVLVAGGETNSGTPDNPTLNATAYAELY